MSVTLDFGALEDPEGLPMGGDCGCGCGGTGGCGSPQGSPQWARVTGAPQRRAGPVAAPVPLMEGFEDPEAFGAPRECQQYTIAGRSPSDPCGLFCTAANWRDWTEAALDYLDQADHANNAGAIAMMGKGPRVAHLRFLVQRQEAGSMGPQIPNVGSGGAVAANLLEVQTLANIVTELRCLIEDAQKVATAAGKRIDPLEPARREGPAEDPNKPPLWDPSSLFKVPEWVKAAGLVAIVFLITRK